MASNMKKRDDLESHIASEDPDRPQFYGSAKQFKRWGVGDRGDVRQMQRFNRRAKQRGQKR